MALKDVVQRWTWWWCQADGWTWWSYRSFPTLTILWFNASDVGRREKERIFWQESQSVFFMVFGWKRRGLPSAPGFFVVFWSTQKYLLPAVWDHRLFSQDYKGWIEVGWSFLTIFLTRLWSGVKARTARSWDKQDFLTVWSKHGPERGMRQQRQPTPSRIGLEGKCSQRGDHTACMGEDGIQHQLFGEKVSCVTEAVSGCPHGNRTWGAGWFRRTGADFGNQESNDSELVDGEGRQPEGQGNHWQAHLPLPEKRSFFLGRSARKILLK